MKLHSLKYNEGSRRKRKRIGRGEGSGRGGTATRGTKGQKSRAGARIPAWFEGGQMPLTRRIPKYGFKNPNRVSRKPINLGRISALLDAGAIDSGETLTNDVFHRAGVIGKHDQAKVLGFGEITKAITVALPVSESARKKIEAAGGSISEPDSEQEA